MMEIRFWRREKLCRTFVLGTGLVLASAFLFSEPLYSAVRAEISTAGTPAAVASDALVADIQGGRTLSLAALDEMALANHPTIQAYEQKISALNGRWQQAGLGPNPEIGYKWEEFNEDAPGGNQVLEFSQEILGGSQLYHAQAYVSQQIETVRQELEIAKLRVLTDVRVAVYEYLAIQNKLVHLREISENDAKLAERIQVSFDNQNASRLDLVNVRIQARKSEQAYLDVQTELDAAWKRLAVLTGIPDMGPCVVEAALEEIPKKKTWEHYVQMLQHTSPEIARAQAKVLEAEKKIAHECSLDSTNVRVGGELAYSTGEEMMVGTVSLSVPLRIRDRNQGNISAARSEAIQAQNELERVSLGIRHRLADVYAGYTNADRNLELYRTSLLPEAEEMLKLATVAYENQESSMLDLVHAQRVYRETSIEYYDALCEYWKSLTLLEGKLLSGGLDDASM